MDEGNFDENPFIDPDDPAAVERERRRQEREARRRAAAERKPAETAPSISPVGAPPAGDSPTQTAIDDPEPRPMRKARPVRPRPTGKRRAYGGRRSLGIRRALAVVVGLLGLAAVWFVFALMQPFHGEGGERINLQVPEGAGIGEIGDLLEERGVIADSRLFQLRVTLSGKRSEMYPGTYTLSEDMSYSEAIEALSTMPVERTLTITIPEGFNRQQVAELVAEAGLPGNYMRASRRSARLDPADYGGRGAESLEGFLFPATYELPADAGAAALVNHQVEAFKDRLAGVGMRRARARNLNVYDVVTIAAMIEREVSIAEERPLVAAVIYNRLQQGIPLGIDATTRFAVDNHTEPLTQSQLDSDSPYNTRVHAGLPPGPIGNPGEESIRAAANPARSDALYYVVKPGTCGEHAFSSNFEQFQRDVAAYNRAREEAGGRSPTECP